MNGGRPRAVRSRFTRTKSCSASLRCPNPIVLNASAPIPSPERALVVAAMTLSRHKGFESSLPAGHAERKLGDGGTFACGFRIAGDRAKCSMADLVEGFFDNRELTTAIVANKITKHKVARPRPDHPTRRQRALKRGNLCTAVRWNTCCRLSRLCRPWQMAPGSRATTTEEGVRPQW